MADRADATRLFYGRWAPVYDLVATRTPGVGALRERAADALALDAGDTVVDVGCGTGATLPHLRERVGPAGRVVGVDITPALLDRARRRSARRENVTVVAGDATRLPLDGPVDAVLGSFVVGMFANPAAAVTGWLDLLAPGGRVALLDAASSQHRAGTALNPLFGAFVRAGSPPGATDGGVSALTRLDRRVAAAHGELRDRTGGVTERSMLGFVRLTAGGV